MSQNEDEVRRVFYERGWQSAIEAAAQHIPCGEILAEQACSCGWEIDLTDASPHSHIQWADHIRSLRPSPAPENAPEKEKP
jgi:hypothetical protein